MATPWISFDEGSTGARALFESPRAMILAWTPEEVPAALEALARATVNGHWLAGYAAYELSYVLMPKMAEAMPQYRDTPLLAFGEFDAPDYSVSEPTHEMAPDALAPWQPQWDEAAYSSAFERMKSHIEAGDIYQANLTFPLLSETRADPIALYAALRTRQPVGHGAYVDFGTGPVILSRSPELSFRTDASGKIETRPMKGTVARHADPETDAALLRWLKHDEKNRAENLMIVDLLRNDLGRIAELGSVKVPELFNIETYATVHQMVSRVTAQLRRGIHLPDIFRALLPSGSITGAPKLRAMQIIRELEPMPRGVYCGAIGWMGPDGSSCFNVAIRTLSLFDSGDIRLNVGGGIVYDSRAGSEYEEALWKTRFAHLSP